MKIVLLSFLHGAGGAERQILMLGKELCDRNHDVYLIVLAEYSTFYQIDSRIHIIDLTKYDTKKGLTIFNRYKALKKTYKTIMPNITIHYWVQTVYLTTLIPFKYRGAIIYSERGDPGDNEYRGLLYILRKLSFKKVNGFVFQSEGARDYFSESIKNRSVVIHNALTIPNDYCIKKPIYRRKAIVSVGRLHPQKNQILLIRAFAIFLKQHSDYTLEIYGEGDLLDFLQAETIKLNIEKHVCFKGNCRNVFDCIKDASLFVLSSDYEGMPNALLEAMALGLPCISTDCKPGGARTLIKSGENGIIVKCNDVEEMATSMINVIGNKIFMEKVASNAMQIKESHTSKQIFDKWNMFIDSIITNSNK